VRNVLANWVSVDVARERVSVEWRTGGERGRGALAGERGAMDGR